MFLEIKEAYIVLWANNKWKGSSSEKIYLRITESQMTQVGATDEVSSDQRIEAKDTKDFFSGLCQSTKPPIEHIHPPKEVINVFLQCLVLSTIYNGTILFH